MDAVMIVLIVVGILILISIIFGIRIMLGRKKIKILLEKYDFTPGDKVSGKLLVNTNLPEINALNIGLSCYLVERSYSGGSSGKNKRKVFEFEKPLKVSGGLTKGTEVPFELSIPKDVMVKIENKVAKAAIGVISALSGMSRRYDWYVEARIDKQGLDIKNWQKIVVN